jgi:hypothetical protein
MLLSVKGVCVFSGYAHPHALAPFGFGRPCTLGSITGALVILQQCGTVSDRGCCWIAWRCTHVAWGSQVPPRGAGCSAGCCPAQQIPAAPWSLERVRNSVLREGSSPSPTPCPPPPAVWNPTPWPLRQASVWDCGLPMNPVCVPCVCVVLCLGGCACLLECQRAYFPLLWVHCCRRHDRGTTATATDMDTTTDLYDYDGHRVHKHRSRAHRDHDRDRGRRSRSKDYSRENSRDYSRERAEGIAYTDERKDRLESPTRRRTDGALAPRKHGSILGCGSRALVRASERESCNHSGTWCGVLSAALVVLRGSPPWPELCLVVMLFRLLGRGVHLNLQPSSPRPRCVKGWGGAFRCVGQHAGAPMRGCGRFWLEVAPPIPAPVPSLPPSPLPHG